MPPGVSCDMPDTPLVRLLARVRQDDSGCSVWLGTVNPQGYGRLSVRGRLWAAHRLSWHLHRGDIPPGVFVLHRCDNPGCVNPEHLWLGTQQDNVDDMVAKGRACFRGKGSAHPRAKLTEEKVLAIRAALAGGVSLRSQARAYGVSEKTLRDLRARVTWRHT